MPKTLQDTLLMMRITRVHHCSVVDDRDTYKGMLQKVRSYIAWGEIDEETFLKLKRKLE